MTETSFAGKWYGRWSFQGIAASLKEGLLLGGVLRQI
jgi:hypothetical protein